MIIEAIVNLITAILKAVFNLLPNVPQLPQAIVTSYNNVMDTIFNHLELLSIFVRIPTIKILAPLVIIVVNFEHIYHFTMWIIKKLPLSID